MVIEHQVARALAEEKKKSGNKCFKKKKYYAALQLYKDAIKLCSDEPIFYLNAAACNIMLGLHSDALFFSHKAIKIDPNICKGFVKIAKCNASLGNVKAASRALRKAKELGTLDKLVLKDIDIENKRLEKLKTYTNNGKAAVGRSDYATAISMYEHACSIAISSYKLKITLAEIFIYAKLPDKAKNLAHQIMSEQLCVENGYYIIGLIAYYSEDLKTAYSEWNKAIKLVKTHKSGKCMEIAKKLYKLKDDGNQAYKKRQYEKALNFYGQALKIDPKNFIVCAKLNFNIAQVFVKRYKDNSDVIKLLTNAIKLWPEYTKAYLQRAFMHKKMEHYDKAIADYEIIVKKYPSKENMCLLNEAKDLADNKRYKKQKKANHPPKRKEYYKILNVESNSSSDDIKKSYKALALKHHPDKHQTKEAKMENEKIFKVYT